MKKLIVCIFGLFVSSLLSAQNNTFIVVEDSLFKLRNVILLEESDSLKLQLNTKFTAQFQRILSLPNSINYPFDTLKSIAILTPEDKSFRIFNWEISLSDNSISYFGIIQTINKNKNKSSVIVLNDKSSGLKKPELSILDANNWYGAHYYKLIETKRKKKYYYTLLGANWSHPLVRKKIIEVIRIGKDGKVKFGEAIFQMNNVAIKRVLFQYASEISMSLRFDENKKMILFDHLVPREPNLKGQFEFYGPDMSIDGFDFLKGKWVYKEDVDARNQKK